ncbi:uncharacterized protein MYCGRDRAFT_87313 [Zymoseptoria tritici IPO323]|uniref:Rrp15p-domain-containing protein n=1 Tax=Zymoseptoria tritici (strain CBS 115943 / IPO323) TaxID=336722 RepID=F9XH14_ZYMTI|nr:uncharacterized protein MYCGRDRAFT_87313 [Zymoseptoria tritici IPO323]EGP85221.1 hypothetical protein MYCGRDRAFT_87313 [Zymoseptoria tritici IPO323]
MPPAPKRRRGDDEPRKPKKKVKRVKKQTDYHSSSEDSDDEDANEDMDDAEDEELQKNTALNMQPDSASDSEADVEDLQAADDDDSNDEDLDDEPDLASSASGSDSETSATSSQPSTHSKKKRNDPTAFATSITKILSTKLSTAKRSDPVLSRSASAAEANRTLADQKLDALAKAQIRAEKRAIREKGRVKDVLGLETPEVDTGAVLEAEKRLKKTAQRGVVKLFNAVRAAQVKGESAAREARDEGVVGWKKREERVNEMSKQGFLDLLKGGGKVEA